jgi:hypothetical protein
MLKINKKIVIGISITVILFFAGIIGWVFLQKQKSLLPGRIIEEEKTTEQLLQELTPAQLKVLTPEEQKKLTELLKELTPAQPKPLTEKEQKELGELLKQLTP